MFVKMVVSYSSSKQGLWIWTAWIGMNPHLASSVTLGKLFTLSGSLFPPL